VWDIKRDTTNEFAPTQKPVALALRAIQNHKVSLVLDVFGGSGSTLIACEKVSVPCRMLEIEPKQVDIIVKRWEKYTGHKASILPEGVVPV
jgi:DNA modification methylase